MNRLQNVKNKEELKQWIKNDPTPRTTISFYRYVKIQNPQELRDKLFLEWNNLGALGRIYLSNEGINSQMSIPTKNLEKFREALYQRTIFQDIPFKIAVEDDGKSFYKLTIKVREKIVADGLDDSTFDPSNVGKHLNAKEFNQAIEQGAIVVDMRNQYESEVGHFENAICPDADTFREELPMVEEILKKETHNNKNRKILFYCTGGIRCEKASAYFKHRGYKNVHQLKGGIIDYAHQIKEQNLPSKFKGKNFVFDERIGERITEDILSNCHQCQEKCDTHTNCKNDDCHLLFIQCQNCAEKFQGCCTTKCQEISNLSIEEQRKIRKGKNKQDALAVYKSRLRPKLNA